MAQKPPTEDDDLSAEAEKALSIARSMPNGPEKFEALKKAGLLRNAALDREIAFAKRGRPPKCPE
jgi:hypothetical protein